jgi:hypothetical protein
MCKDATLAVSENDYSAHSMSELIENIVLHLTDWVFDCTNGPPVPPEDLVCIIARAMIEQHLHDKKVFSDVLEGAPEFERLWDEARRAGQIAAEAQFQKLGENNRDLDTRPTDSWGPSPGDGSAYIELPSSLPFAQWAKQQDIAWVGGPNRLQIWDSQFSVCTEAMSVHEAAARAACDVLTRSLQTSAISVNSQID